jgi:ribosomal protein S18 acetylase RimI-like enzyme
MSTAEHRLSIRRADSADVDSLVRLGAATFTETFGHLYPPEDLQAFLLNSHSRQTWQTTLADSQTCIWVAEDEAEGMIGYIAVGRCKLPVQEMESTAGEVQQLYVLAKFHDLKLGTRLMQKGLNWLQSQARTPLYIGVWSENSGAQRFYSRYGFTKIGEYGFRVGNTIDREFILKRTLG